MCNNNIISENSIKLPIQITNRLFGSGGCVNGINTDIIKKLIKPTDDIVVITCREEVSTAIKNITGAEIRKVISIPSEAAFRKCFQENINQGSQLPLRMNQIINASIPKHVKPGTIVLLGTGPTKPMYCEAIKKCGGVALDLGSSLDVICGYVTRGKRKGSLVNNS